MGKGWMCSSIGRMRSGHLSSCRGMDRVRVCLGDSTMVASRSSFMPGFVMNDIRVQCVVERSSKTLSAADLRDPEISALIASKLREFHDLDMPGPRKVHLWDRLRNWHKAAQRLCSTEQAKEFCLDTLEEEISSLEKLLAGDDQRIGFCHNDLQYGNIMMDEETKQITIIDYEYASFNPIAYDIANHFCEMAADYHTGTPHVLDYSKYPDLEDRKRYVNIYVKSPGEDPSEVELEDLLESIEKYALVSHLIWGLWGIISEHVNEIDFDYAEYARQRFQQYRLRKPILLDQGFFHHTI